MQRVRQISSSNSQKIHYISLDFDGCIFNDRYMLEECDFIEDNEFQQENIEEYVKEIENTSPVFYVLTKNKLFYVSRERGNRIISIDINPDQYASLKRELNLASKDGIRKLSLAELNIIFTISGHPHSEFRVKKSVKKGLVISSNKKLINKLVKNAKEADQVFLGVGSNRQSKKADDANMRAGKGSCYPAIKEIAKYFKSKLGDDKCSVDPYLLCDSYGNREEGETYQHALDLNKLRIGDERATVDYDFPNWFCDKSKVSVLYAQIHRMASKNPDAEIIYDFYDDLDPILGGLKSFYGNNKDLIPYNVTLRLNKYKGEAVTSAEEIKGQGNIDFCYNHSIKTMITCCNQIPEFLEDQDYAGEGNFADDLNVDQFKLQRSLNRLSMQINELDKLEETKEKPELIIALRNLYNELQQDIEAQKKKKLIAENDIA